MTVSHHQPQSSSARTKDRSAQKRPRPLTPSRARDGLDQRRFLKYRCRLGHRSERYRQPNRAGERVEYRRNARVERMEGETGRGDETGHGSG